MKLCRPLLVLAFLALTTSVVPGVLAQDTVFGLPIQDWDLLRTASEATANATSAQFNFTLDLSATVRDRPYNLDVSGSGLYGTDPAGQQLFQLLLNGTAIIPVGDSQRQIALNLEARSVNESLYLMLPVFFGPQWVQLTSEDLSEGVGGVPIDLTGAGTVSGLQNVQLIGQLLTQLRAIGGEEFIRITRNGNDFTTTIDIVGLLGSPSFQDALRLYVETNPDASRLSPAELLETLANLPAALEGSNLTIQQTLGPDSLISRTVLTLNLNIDPALITTITLPPTLLAINLDMTMSGYNGVYSVDVPDDAILFDELAGSLTLGG